MTIIRTPHDFTVDDLFVDLSEVVGARLYLKIEGLNLAGSIKLKAAAEMIDRAVASGRLTSRSVLVESSSGNLGVAVSIIAAARGYRFVCVVDPRCNPATRRLMAAYGTCVDEVTQPHPRDGYLGARLSRVRELCEADPRYVWLDQYSNPGNWQAHYQRTAPEIAAAFPQLDVLFVGAGTTGTLMGCARFFRSWHRRVHVVAVDSEGSVTFGGPPGRRMLPGLGTSVRPPQLDESVVDEVLIVGEPDTVRTSHAMAARGFLFGGSTGTVVTGATSWLAEHDPASRSTAVAIAPDLGERYLDTLYDPAWVLDAYGVETLSALAVHKSSAA